MLAVAFPAAAFGTNCYVLAPGPGEECVVVDPGIGVEQTLRDVLAEHRLGRRRCCSRTATSTTSTR